MSTFLNVLSWMGIVLGIWTLVSIIGVAVYAGCRLIAARDAEDEDEQHREEYRTDRMVRR